MARSPGAAAEYRELPVQPVRPVLLRSLDDLNRMGQDVYVTVNPVRRVPQPGSRRLAWGRTRAHIREPLRVQLDIDAHASDAVPALAADVLSGVVPAPSLILRTSPGKYQMLWNLPRGGDAGSGSRPWTPAVAEYYSYLMARRYGADKTIYPVSQILRVPGYYNRKPQYGDDPPLVRPCAQSRRQWFRPSGAPHFAPSDFETLQSVVRPADLALALAKFTPSRGAAVSPEHVAALQEKFRPEIEYTHHLHAEQARPLGMDTDLVFAAGREAVVRIVERLDAEDERAGRSRAAAPRRASARAPASRAPSAPPSDPPASAPIVEPFRVQRDRARAAVVHGAGAPAPAEVWVLGRDGLPQLRTVSPTAREVGYGLGLHDAPLVTPAARSRTPLPPPRTSSAPAGSQSDFADWGFTMRFLEDGYAPDAVALALAARRAAGPDQKRDPEAYAAKTVRRAVAACRDRAAEAGEEWEPGDRVFDGPEEGSPAAPAVAPRAPGPAVPPPSAAAAARASAASPPASRDPAGRA